MKARILLCISELYPIPGFELAEPGLGGFPGYIWLAGLEHKQAPGARQDGIHDNLLGIDPDDGQVHERRNEEHVDGSIETIIACFNKQQASI